MHANTLSEHILRPRWPPLIHEYSLEAAYRMTGSSPEIFRSLNIKLNAGTKHPGNLYISGRCDYKENQKALSPLSLADLAQYGKFTMIQICRARVKNMNHSLLCFNPKLNCTAQGQVATRPGRKKNLLFGKSSTFRVGVEGTICLG